MLLNKNLISIFPYGDRGAISIRKILIALIAFELVAMIIILWGDEIVWAYFFSIVFTPLFLIAIPLDPVVGLGVALIILKAAYDVTRKSFRELVDVRLPKVEEDEVVSCIEEHSGQLAGFHRVRTRKAGNQRFIDLHLVMPKSVSVAEAHQMCDHLEQDMKNRLPNSSVTIHVEPCDAECEQCRASSCSQRITVTAGRQKIEGE